MKKASRHRLLIPVTGALCCVLLAGCGVRAHEAEPGVPAPRAISTSRVVLPTAGGQTIRIPAVMMADAHQLWRPLHASERKRLRKMPPVPAGAFGSDNTAWMPPTETDVMQRYLYRLTHSRRDLAIRVLGRAENYLPVILDSLGARGLPLELACLPMVESAFEPGAVSPAGAAGLWQLMPQTARRFGLAVNAEIDERFDVRKSTAAATAYLAALYSIFNDWSLALAAYNCGEGAMQKALSCTGAMTLSELTRACRVVDGADSPLAEETLRFVPQFAAAVHIMTNSNAFGLSDHAVLSLESPTVATQSKDSALTLVGRYENALEPKRMPARSQRIE